MLLYILSKQLLQPANLPPNPSSLPPVGPPTPNQPGNPHHPTPVLTELQTQLHDTRSSLASHVDKVRALEGVVAEHDAVKREICALRELVEKVTTTKCSSDNENGRNREEGREEEFGSTLPRSMPTIRGVSDHHSARVRGSKRRMKS